MDIDQRKALARHAAFARRKDAFAAGLDAKAQDFLRKALKAHAGKTLAGYMPINTEISPLPVMEAWQGEVCVPFVKGKGKPLDFLRWKASSEMEKGAFGAPVPKDKTPVIPEIVIAPLVAFDRTCHRLGYGGGFYDRSLAEIRKSHPLVAIGFAYNAQYSETLPLEKTDVALDMIVTEKGITDAKQLYEA